VSSSGDLKPLKRENPKSGPKKNRLHDYEAGWLTLLIEMGMVTKEQANEAMCRVAQATIDEANERREGGGQRGRASENASSNDSAAINPVSRHRNMRKALKESN